MKSITFLILFLFTTIAYSQNTTKELQAIRVNKAPKIDGKLDDLVWQNANVARDFVMYEPGSGDLEAENQKTEVRVIYDDEAIYIGAILFDVNPDKILKQLTDRDNFGTTDVFGLSINPNNDGQNEFMFFVTAAGVQLDAQVSPSNGDDFSWNEIWFSKVSFDEKAWYVEMKLPYSALRFSSDNLSIWGINFWRNIEQTRELYSWNFIDKTVGNTSQYTGNLTGLKNIKPPVRLGLSPFTSFSLGSYDGETDTNFAFGLDLKYGITDNFTLFATLVPDFSQAGFDNITLNLGPFEQRFDEQRQFFIEGADLLNKGNLFFSRRIGNRPVDYFEVYNDLDDNEDVGNNPTEVDVVNAIKVTGRSKKGLGIAVLNAITKETKATILDTLSGDKRSIITEPLANYNVLVIDQEFNKNSSIGFVNTNVTRNGSFRDANVSSLVFNLANKENSYKISGDGSTSTIRENQENTTGFASSLRFSKTKGNIRFDLRHMFSDDKYDKNDLGFQRRNNFQFSSANINYQIFKPTKHFNNFRVGLRVGYFRRFKPNIYTGNFLSLYGFATTKKQFAFGGNFRTNIGSQKDYFEPRTENRFWLEDPDSNINAWVSSDYRKKFAYDIAVGGRWYNGNDGYGYWWSFSPRYRVNDKLQFNYSIQIGKKINNLGYVTTLDDETIIFGKRDIKEIENSISSKYSFNNRSSISLAVRHYWSPVTYSDEYFKLENDGTLTDADYNEENDLNFNSWNLDLRYIWEFARGSELVALYRNSILNFGSDANLAFNDNIGNLFDQPLGQSFSIKVIYYLDYNRAKTWL
ncbi:MAG: carbohydrate binding family 9 domain-containing protein [Flavobacteriaceae bacterium]|nr:carbohydrate binding family 9 domain-containing protein [Flavobacteriaceae bacterium]